MNPALSDFFSLRVILLSCGIIAAILYGAADLLLGLTIPDYNFAMSICECIECIRYINQNYDGDHKLFRGHIITCLFSGHMDDIKSNLDFKIRRNIYFC